MHSSKSVTPIILRALDAIDGDKESHDLLGFGEDDSCSGMGNFLQWLVETWSDR